MLRTSLNDAQRADLQSLRRTDLPAVARDRPEMVLLAAAGWSPPRIARHLSRHPHAVRAALKGFAARGTMAFHPDAPGPAPDHARRAAVTGKRSDLLGQDRTRAARQLADALGPGVGTGRRPARRSLVLLRAGYRRAARTVGHTQDPGTVPFERTLTSDDLIASRRGVPPADVPRVVVPDTAGIHTGRVLTAARPGLAKQGIDLYDLPPYSPELNRVGPVVKPVEHHDRPTRRFTSTAKLRTAVEDGRS